MNIYPHPLLLSPLPVPSPNNNLSPHSLIEQHTAVSMKADSMNRSAAYQQQQQQKVGVVAEMIRGGEGGADSAFDGVVCPKPRRMGIFPRDYPFRPSPFLHINNQQMESYDAKAANELLDIILSKGNYGGEKSNYQVASSPPFFNGSPPCRASNPLIQDEQFGNSVVKVSPSTPVFEPSASASPSSLKTGGGFILTKYGTSPTPVRRIEGFNCCGISAVA